jgi:hypothetical protein
MRSEQCDTAAKPDSTAIPVQVSAPEFAAFILPHLSLPERGPKCKIGYHKPFNYILKVLYTGMQWRELPIDKGPRGPRGTALHGRLQALCSLGRGWFAGACLPRLGQTARRSSQARPLLTPRRRL